MKEIDDFKEISAIEILDEQYREAENKSEIDFWTPLTKIIMESMEIRSKKSLSQNDLAKLMKTKQSVISRFENMGRLPNYDFVSRLAIALGHPLGMTMYGDFMAVIPGEKQKMVKEFAEKENLSTADFTQELLDKAVESITDQYVESQSIDINTEVVFSGGISIDVNNTLSSYLVIPNESQKDDRLTA